MFTLFKQVVLLPAMIVLLATSSLAGTEYAIQYKYVGGLPDTFLVTVGIPNASNLDPIVVNPPSNNTNSSNGPAFFVILPDGNFMNLNELNQYRDYWIPQKPAGTTVFYLGDTQVYALEKNDPNKPPKVTAIWDNEGPIPGTGPIELTGPATPAVSDYLDGNTGRLKVGTSWAPWDNPNATDEFYYLILTFTVDSTFDGKISFRNCKREGDTDFMGFAPVSYLGYNLDTIGWSESGSLLTDRVKLKGVPPGEVRHVYVRMERPIDAAPASNLVSYEAQLIRQLDTVPVIDAIATCKEILLGGFPHDPNEKRVDQSACTQFGVGQLTYWVTFQNEGTAPAFDVLVKEHFGEHYDPSTFKLLDHGATIAPDTTQSLTNPSQWDILFKGINLPGLAQKHRRYTYDETVNWFSFKVTAACNAPLSNAVDIIFIDIDSVAQPPISTEPAHTTPDFNERSNWPPIVLPGDGAMPASLNSCDEAVSLLFNGNFQWGIDGPFQSELTKACNTCAAATYCVGNRFQNKCNTWPSSFFDHTKKNAGGSMLLIDGHASAPAMVWSDSVCVDTGRTYVFSFWFKSRNKTWNNQSPLALGMVIDGVEVKTVTIKQPSLDWEQYEVSWTRTDTNPGPRCLSIGLKQLNDGAHQDFALDDIFFGYCPP